MRNMWTCPKCTRRFTRANQRHACGTGERVDPLRNRPAAVLELYAAIEAFARSLGPIEVVTGDRYVLLRSVRIFADLVIMAGAVRVAVHLGRKVDVPLLFKVGSNRRFVTHVAKLTTREEFEQLKPFLEEAYRFSIEPG